jgi:hypothetical protein
VNAIKYNPKGRKTIHMSPCNDEKRRKKKQMGENYFTKGRKREEMITRKLHKNEPPNGTFQ